nr:MAG TPA: zinc-ribbon domain protein [Caudoviricetes sp.]
MRNKQWVKCPYCGKKLAKILPDALCKGVFVWCKSCKKEIEIKRP